MVVGDPYLNLFLFTLVAFPAYALDIILLKYVGRRVVMCLSTTLGGLACIATAFPAVFGGKGELQWIIVLRQTTLYGVVTFFHAPRTGFCTTWTYSPFAFVRKPFIFSFISAAVPRVPSARRQHFLINNHAHNSYSLTICHHFQYRYMDWKHLVCSLLLRWHLLHDSELTHQKIKVPPDLAV